MNFNSDVCILNEKDRSKDRQCNGMFETHEWLEFHMFNDFQLITNEMTFSWLTGSLTVSTHSVYICFLSVFRGTVSITWKEILFLRSYSIFQIATASIQFIWVLQKIEFWISIEVVTWRKCLLKKAVCWCLPLTGTRKKWYLQNKFYLVSLVNRILTRYLYCITFVRCLTWTFPGKVFA